jgi:hypothetical protein
MRTALLLLALASTTLGPTFAGGTFAAGALAADAPVAGAAAANASAAESWAPQPAARADAFAQLQALSGDWEADLPGYGKMQDTVRLISNGMAIEETIGTAANNEASLYTRDGDRILMTHYCAMTPDGHQVRLETAALQGSPDRLEFVLVGSTNLHDPTAPHMRLMSLTLVDHDHFSERWTKTEAGKDTVFEMHFARR